MDDVQYRLSLKDDFTGVIKSADAATQHLHSSIGSLGAALGVTFGIAGVTMFVKSMIEAGTQVENAQTGLTTLLKDAGQARQVIANTVDDATKTPFAFEGLLMANKALISAGESATKSRQAVLDLANAIAATGGGDDELQRMVINIQQVRNTGQATAMDIKQFAFAGINIYKVLEEAGIKVTKGSKDSAVSYDMLTQALHKAHEAGGIYFNGLENMAGNTSVKISNLGDAIFQLKVKMFNDLKPAIEYVITGLFKLIDHLKQGWEWIQKNKEVVEGLTIALSSAWAAYKVIGGGVAIMEALGVAGAVALGPYTLLLATLTGIGVALATMDSADTLRVKAIEKSDKESIEKEKQALQQDISNYKKNGFSEKDAIKRIQESRLPELQKDLKTYQDDLDKATFRQNLLREQGFNSQADDLEYSIGKARSKVNATGLMIADVKQLGMKQMGSAGTKMSLKDDTKTRAVGSKNITINVHINDLIKTMTINTTNIKGGFKEARDGAVEAFMGMLNDVQLTAGQ